jgi:hypothetical protein
MGTQSKPNATKIIAVSTHSALVMSFISVQQLDAIAILAQKSVERLGSRVKATDCQGLMRTQGKIWTCPSNPDSSKGAPLR